MKTLNNIFMTAGDPYKRYITAVVYPITGWRIDPDTNRAVEFTLTSPGKEMSYEDEVLELYSDREVKFFLQKNKYLLESGLVKEFSGEPDEVDLTNALNDDEVFAAANIRLQNDLKARLAELTSIVTVKRILLQAKEIGRPIKILEIIENRLKELSIT